MLQIFVSLAIMIVIMGVFFAITVNRKEGRELKKSCGCSIPGNEKSGCMGSCQS
ncbi:MAG: hypothetical protein M0P66_01700 [Salinivirgaceae bacterium]|nr:hypothetical protein [Salinivirgaceae bacterium]